MNFSEKVQNIIENGASLGFVVKDCVFCGEEAFLVFPSKKSDAISWTQENSIFRSSIWKKGDYKLLSAGFKKFTNIGENPDNFPPPKSLEGASVMSKEDGSCLIVDWSNDQLSLRTRGTVSAFTLDNAQDFRVALNKYNLAGLAAMTPELTWLFEIVSPNQKIVLPYPDVDLFLIGAIDKRTYRLCDQDFLDQIGRMKGIPRPKRYEFKDLEELESHFQGMEGLEGCCIYTEHDQTIHKVKTEWYKSRHRLLSKFCSFSSVFDFYLQNLTTDANVFLDIIKNESSYETAETFKNEIQDLAESYKKFLNYKKKIHNFIETSVLPLNNRAEQAKRIREEYSTPWRVHVAFVLLDDGEINPKVIKAAIEFYLNKKEKKEENFLDSLKS